MMATISKHARLSSLILLTVFSGFASVSAADEVPAATTMVASDQPGTTCEFLLLSRMAEEGFQASFRRQLKDQTFSLLELNPSASAAALARFQWNTPPENSTTLKILQYFADLDPKSAFTLQIRDSAVHHEILGAHLTPARFWAHTVLSPAKLEKARQLSGGGWLKNQELQDHVTQNLSANGVLQGFVFDENENGTRSYLTFGRGRDRRFQLTLGVDVPCERAAEFTSEPEKAMPLLSESGRLCRVPVAVFQRSP